MTTSTVPSRALAPDVDPVRFEVIRNALLAITEEMGATLRRAAYSTNIKTRGDFSCAFFDRDLRTIAQAFAQPAHLGVNLESLKSGVRRDLPDLGEHSSEVLAEAGLTAEQIAKPRAKGALGGT